MKVHIHALINTYNDSPTLPLALDSVKDVVDSIIVADGAYKKYYDNYRRYKEVKPYSTDGTLEIIKALEPNLPPTKIIECPNGEPWINQTIKRTALLDAVPVKDWFCILDSDEMFYGHLRLGVEEIMGSGCIAGSMPLYTPGVEQRGFYPFWHPRIFLKLPDMYYDRKHWLLCDFANRVVESDYPVYNTNQCVLTHLKLFRNMRRLVPHMSYMLDMSKTGWLEPQTHVFKSEIDYEEEMKTK